MSYLDPKFRYRSSDDHGDASRFRRRQRERIRTAQASANAKAEADAREAAAKVRPIAKRRAAAGA